MPPHHPRTFRPFAAAMRRCKQGAMRKILKYAAIVLVLLLVAAGIAFYVMSRPDAAHFSTAELSGRVPVMAAQHPEMFPTMNVPEATSWPANAAPTPAQGLTVARFAEGLQHPRSILVLPDRKSTRLNSSH